jgi:hypothetical protein
LRECDVAVLFAGKMEERGEGGMTVPSIEKAP